MNTDEYNEELDKIVDDIFFDAKSNRQDELGLEIAIKEAKELIQQLINKARKMYIPVKGQDSDE